MKNLAPAPRWAHRFRWLCVKKTSGFRKTPTGNPRSGNVRMVNSYIKIKMFQQVWWHVIGYLIQNVHWENHRNRTQIIGFSSHVWWHQRVIDAFSDFHIEHQTEPSPSNNKKSPWNSSVYWVHVQPQTPDYANPFKGFSHYKKKNSFITVEIQKNLWVGGKTIGKPQLLNVKWPTFPFSLRYIKHGNGKFTIYFGDFPIQSSI